MEKGDAVTTSRRHARSFRLGCRCYALQDAAVVALLALVIGGFVLQILRGPTGTWRAPHDEMTSAELGQDLVIA
jgi:hypothetical protein